MSGSSIATAALLAAFCFVMLLCAITIWGTARSPQRRPSQNGEQRANHPQDDQPAGGHNDSGILRRPANPEGWHPQEQEHRRKERQYWLFQNAAVFLLVFAAGGAIASAIYAAGAMSAAQDAARAARDQVENMDRPWIKMVLIERPDISFTGPGMATQFGFPGEEQEIFFNGSPRIRNVGKTTAVHVHVRIKFVIHKWANGWGDFSSEQKAACVDAGAMNGGFEATLFPDDSFDGIGVGDGVYLSQDNTSVVGETKYVAPAVVGCIDYQFSSSQRHHQTRFIYEVVRSDNRTRIFVLGHDAKEADIALIRDPQYDYAD